MIDFFKMFHECNFKVARVITIYVSNYITFYVNYPPMTSAPFLFFNMSHN